MITIFSSPKKFYGQADISQRNAIKSWLNLGAGCEIIIFGDAEGSEAVAREFGLKYIGGIKKSETGRELLDDIFCKAQKEARHDVLLELSCDIILFPDILEAVKKINLPVYLMAGRRWDLDVKEEINFSDPDWGKKMKEEAMSKGKLHGYSATDYFIFPKNFKHGLLPFSIGVVGWDSWMLYNTKLNKVPIIDATESIFAVHQNHDYSHSPFANEKKGRIEGPEIKRNFKIAGSPLKMLTLREADMILTKSGLEKPKFPRSILSKIALFYPWRLLISAKRKIKNLL